MENQFADTKLEDDFEKTLLMIIYRNEDLKEIIKNNKDKFSLILCKQNSKIYNQMTLLHHSVKKDNEKAVQTLLFYKMNVNAKDDNQATPLHYAQSVYVAKLLIDNGADLNAVDADDTSVLVEALLMDNVELLHYFLFNTNINTEDLKEYCDIKEKCSNSELFHIARQMEE